jgi:hypothetical protein
MLGTSGEKVKSNFKKKQRGGYTSRAKMQESENTGVAGGATWKLLKTKVQFCRESDTVERWLVIRDW